jgi:hypothetical protein
MSYYFNIFFANSPARWLAILVGRLGLTLPQAKEEYVVVLKLRRSRDSLGLAQFLKDVVKKYTGSSETLMFEKESATAHCHT